MRLALYPIATAFAALAGCAHSPETVPIELLGSGDGRECRFEAEGRVVAEGSPAEAQPMLARAARRWKGRSVIILPGAELPYNCFGVALFVLQNEMVDGRIGFISEPPPRPD